MNKKTYRLLFASISSLSIAIAGCNKENLDVANPAPSTPYLQFADANALKSAISEIGKSPSGSRASAIADVIRAHAGGDGGANFRSLLTHP